MSDWDGSGLAIQKWKRSLRSCLSGILSSALLSDEWKMEIAPETIAVTVVALLGLLTWQFGSPHSFRASRASAEAEAVISLVAEKLSDLAGSLYRVSWHRQVSPTQTF